MSPTSRLMVALLARRDWSAVRARLARIFGGHVDPARAQRDAEGYAATTGDKFCDCLYCDCAGGS